MHDAASTIDVMRDPTAGVWDDDRFDAIALDLYRAQRAAVPVYDAWCAYELDTRDNPAVSSWREVPALPILAFRQASVTSAGSTPAATWRSSGTTEQGRSTHALLETAQYDASLDAGVASALVPDIVAGERPPLRCVQLHPTAFAAPDSSLTHMFDRIRSGPWCIDRDAFVDGDFHIDAQVAWSALEACAAASEPVLVLATSFALAMLLDEAEGAWEPIRLPAGSRVVDTGGFKGRTREITRDELVARVGHLLGVPPEWCENEYGMAELSSQAWLGTVATASGHPLQTPAPAARWTPPWLRVRVVDPETLIDVADGETGLLVFHDLANVWSCAAVRSEDLGIRRGTGFELIGRAPGATLKGCSLQLEQI